MVNLHLTRQFLHDINGLKTCQPDFKSRLEKTLRQYPASGRLLLNHKVPDAESMRLCEKIRHQLTAGDIRELSFDHCVVVYLLNLPFLYLLACIELKPFGDEAEMLWENKGQ